MGTHVPRTIAFAVRGPIARADLSGLCDRVCALLPAVAVAYCDVSSVPADAVTVDALARLQLAARRRRSVVRLRNASPQLRDLVELMGLTEVLVEVEG
jgi:ABC-type transporter Mla MlaB component